MAKPDPSEYLTVPEVAKMLRVHTSWIYGRTRLNLIPHYKIGSEIRFEPAELEAWLRENFRQDGTGPRPRRPRA